MATSNGSTCSVKNFHRICMVSDFFYPNTGGVESHIFQLSQFLISHGHKVVVITHAYGDRKGVRYMLNGLKVYYLPFIPFHNQCIFPTVFLTGPIIRSILIRENISIVHGHSTFSVLANESMIHARNLGLKTVFTDHSLFGFADASAIITNKLLELVFLDCNSVICVSHVGKENTVLRGKLQPDLVYVIPNAVNSAMFTPEILEGSTSENCQQKKADVTKRHRSMTEPSSKYRKMEPQKTKKKRTISDNYTGTVTVVILSRLVYRKGMDLLVELIPLICNKYPQVDFVVGGDGPKRVDLEEMVEQHELHQRVHLLGSVRHEEVRDVLVRGQIFLNTSLTEAYCMAIVEAASCGLQVVTTDVGGIPEVLPSTSDDHPGKMAWLAKPSVKDLLATFNEAMEDRLMGRVVPKQIAHDWVKNTYTWENVTQLTEQVYDSISFGKSSTLRERLCKCWKGPISHKLYATLVVIDYLVLTIAGWLVPDDKIDKAPTFNFS